MYLYDPVNGKMVHIEEQHIKMAKNDKRPRHTLDDHVFGDYYPHSHDGDADHDHDDIDPGPLEDNPIWQRDNVALSSVGIDIGSAGTQIIFSNVHLQRISNSLASRYVIVDRKTVYESPVSFTPYVNQEIIDGIALGRIIDAAYREAGVRPEDIDTGVVILTGEALRRENAESIAEIIASKGGEFVTATAGHHMEAMLAAYGSGAAKASRDADSRILNIDIGGGTTKLALADRGQVEWTAALHLGGRLIACEGGEIVRLEPAGDHHARRTGLSLSLGARLDGDGIGRIAEGMADLLVGAVTQSPPPPSVQELYLTEIPGDFRNISGIMFSGGVGEYVYGRELRDFGDLGFHLGRILRERADKGDFGVAILPAGACIRATALGASEYSVQLSGQTSKITSPGKILPHRNLQVLSPELDLESKPSPSEIAAKITRHYEAFDLDPCHHQVALALKWHAAPEYSRIRLLADGIVEALAGYIESGKPLYIMIDGDIAQTLGGILCEEIGLENDLLVIDGIILRDFDYVDLGKVRLPSFTVPVTVKSLLFRDDPRPSGRQERVQFRRAVSSQHGHHHHEPEHHHHEPDHGHPRRSGR
jgi:ethanolamine utilization protein EutA